jgi:hypothetical protein
MRVFLQPSIKFSFRYEDSSPYFGCSNSWSDVQSESLEAHTEVGGRLT